MRSEPEVSVVIPTRDRPEMLRRSLQSALLQTGVEVEVVVVVDGDDGVSEVVTREVGDERVRCLVLKEFVGGAEARNVGARAARGEFVALLDDDDEWVHNKLQRQLELARMACAETYVVTTQYVYRKSGQRDEVWPGYLPKGEDDLSEFLFSSCGGFQTSTYLCPRELLLRVPFQRGLKRHQDWDWFLRLLSEPGFRLLTVPEPLSIYWVPLGVRAGVSAKANWRQSREWIRSVRELVSARAYAAFLVRICFRGAALSRESFATLFEIWREAFGAGGLSLELTVQCLACLIVSEKVRDLLRGVMRRLRPSATAACEVAA